MEDLEKCPTKELPMVDVVRGSLGYRCTSFMDERARLAHGSHGHECMRFPWMSVRGQHAVPIDGVHEDHMDVNVQVFMDERARLARDSHGRTCMRFPWMAYERYMDDAQQEEKDPQAKGNQEDLFVTQGEKSRSPERGNDSHT